MNKSTKIKERLKREQQAKRENNVLAFFEEKEGDYTFISFYERKPVNNYKGKVSHFTFF